MSQIKKIESQDIKIENPGFGTSGPADYYYSQTSKNNFDLGNDVIFLTSEIIFTSNELEHSQEKNLNKK